MALPIAMHKNRKFYQLAAVLLTALTCASLLAGYLCLKKTLLTHPLLPASESVVAWSAIASADSQQNGASEIQLHETRSRIDYTFLLSDAIEYGYASVAMRFNDETRPHGFADLSQYMRVRFRAKCIPANTLSFTVFTFDKQLSDVKNLGSYRIPTAYFSCDRHWTDVEIDLQHMEVPEWWLSLHKLKLFDRAYQLEQTSRFSFGVSLQSPRNVASSVKIADIELVERNWQVLYAFFMFAVPTWLAFGFWFFKTHTRLLMDTLQSKVQRDKPLPAYQHVSVESHRDREKHATLSFMSTQYANPEMSVDSATSTLGVGKAKINKILKDETGLTFSAYLNKLRLAEAARLLADEPQANVSVIALSVGYNNVSYFNKLFKNEYGLSPKTYRAHSVKTSKLQDQDSGPDEQNPPGSA